MKEKFTTIDLFAIVGELNSRLPGMRVVNVYDVDQKTYLIKLAKPDSKVMLMFESGCRIHITEFEWPKNMQPSGFSMKLRKHLRARRLISVTQLGVDRVLDLQFGSGEAAYHLILELYDRGNVILTDYEFTILSLLRTRTDADTDVRFAARQTFSTETIKRDQPSPTLEGICDILSTAKAGDQLRQLLNPHFVYGSALISHSLIGAGFRDNVKIGSGCSPEEDLSRVVNALQEADRIFQQLKEQPAKGIIIQKRLAQPKVEEASGGSVDSEDVVTNVEFHPMLFRQHEALPHKEAESFNKAVDEFFSSRSSQKQDMKAINLKKTAMKKLDYIRMDHHKRIDQLQTKQDEDQHKAYLIEQNADLVTKACLVIRSAVANAMDWGDIELLLKDAQSAGDPVASAIKSLKLKTNEITMLLYDYDDSTEEDEDGSDNDMGSAAKETKLKKKKTGTKIDIDLGLSAFANATRYYGHKKQAAKKEQKTIDASEKALKSAQRKTKQSLKEASTVAKILKARKVHWFEKFYWFISSENYLVIGGRDQQQNELVVKKYLKEGDIYVHADLHGATSVVIKNSHGPDVPVPPKTLNEAGFMAVCYSSAWDARIVTSAWWVYTHQVSKTAPTGEYLTTGSFMVRGKKNFLPPCQLVLGFGFLFRIDDSCIANHIHERKVKVGEDEKDREVYSPTAESTNQGDEEIPVEDSNEQDRSDSSREEDGSSEDGNDAFPDTSISVLPLEGEDGLALQCSRTDSVSSEGVSEVVNNPEISDDPLGTKGHQHLSARQKRELRKQRQGKQVNFEVPSTNAVKKSEPRAAVEQVTAKRGKKFKQKKVKEKYRDQDEEERQLMMEFLGSAGSQKETKANKKGKKKSFATTQSSNPKLKYKQEVGSSGNKGQAPLAKQTHKQFPPTFEIVHSHSIPEDQEENQLGEVDMTEDTTTEAAEERRVDGDDAEEVVERNAGSSAEGAKGNNSEAEDGAVGSSEAVDKEREELKDNVEEEMDEEEKKVLMEEENAALLDREQLSDLDSLTGCPLFEDILLYAVPVCGPYSCMLNYKFKVKLIPGTNRRGKAAKAAVLRFTQSKDTFQREKDLLKSVKDNDLSRYIPGKVKMSLPQSTKHRHK